MQNAISEYTEQWFKAESIQLQEWMRAHEFDAMLYSSLR